MAEALVALSNFACEGAQLKFVIICSVFFQSVGECSSASWKDPMIIFFKARRAKRCTIESMHMILSGHSSIRTRTGGRSKKKFRVSLSCWLK